MLFRMWVRHLAFVAHSVSVRPRYVDSNIGHILRRSMTACTNAVQIHERHLHEWYKYMFSALQVGTRWAATSLSLCTKHCQRHARLLRDLAASLISLLLQSLGLQHSPVGCRFRAKAGHWMHPRPSWSSSRLDLVLLPRYPHWQCLDIFPIPRRWDSPHQPHCFQYAPKSYLLRVLLSSNLSANGSEANTSWRSSLASVPHKSSKSSSV